MRTADLRHIDNTIVDNAKFEKLLKVSKNVEAILGKLDDDVEAREAAEAPARGASIRWNKKA
jgi:hypothetical protein